MTNQTPPVTPPQVAPLTSEQPQPPRLTGTIIIIAISVVAAVAIGLLAWVFVEWQNTKTDIQGQIDIAKAEAVASALTEAEANFAEREKLPSLEFTGPDDYGRLSFMHPRTWSIYVAKDAAKGGDYEAYFNPGFVPSTSASPTNRFALRFIIYSNKSYDDALKSYNSLISSSRLTSNIFQVPNCPNCPATRLDGTLSTSGDIVGSAVLIKVNDKAALIQTDTEVGRPDFDALIQTITFN